MNATIQTTEDNPLTKRTTMPLNAPHIRALHEAAQKLLAFSTKAESISIYNIDGGDLRAVGRDLGYIAAEIVDPLIKAYGEYICENSHGIDIDLFTNQLNDALDGMALYEINDAADRMRDELQENVSSRMADYRHGMRP